MLTFSTINMKKAKGNGGHIRTFISTFIIALTYPLTIVIFLAVFASMGFHPHIGRFGNALSLIAGVGIGAMAWWFLLSQISLLVRLQLSPARLQRMHMLSGMLMIVFGMGFLASMLRL